MWFLRFMVLAGGGLCLGSLMRVLHTSIIATIFTLIWACCFAVYLLKIDKQSSSA